MDINKFAPIVELSYTDRADLAAATATPGYKVIHKIMRGEVDKFVLSLINTSIDDEKDLKEVVFSKFLLAKSAAQFYQQVTDRVNEETLQYVASQSRNEPMDATAGILDIGGNIDEIGEGDSLLA